jgi:hypothetical protein
MRETKRRAGDRGDASALGKRTVSWRPSPVSRRVPENRPKTRCGNHPQLAPRASSFLTAAGVTMHIDLTGISKLNSKQVASRRARQVFPRSTDPSCLYKHLAFGCCVAINVRRDV